MSTGIFRRIDPLGRIVVPAEMREALELRAGALVDVSLHDGTIVITPVGDVCVACGRPHQHRIQLASIVSADIDGA